MDEVESFLSGVAPFDSLEVTDIEGVAAVCRREVYTAAAWILPRGIATSMQSGAQVGPAQPLISVMARRPHGGGRRATGVTAGRT
jgi:hypothetical protein